MSVRDLSHQRSSAAMLAMGTLASSLAACTVQNDPSDTRTILQYESGDQVVSDEMLSRRWPNGVIPIKWGKRLNSASSEYDAGEKSRVMAAIFGSKSAGICSNEAPCPGWDAADAIRWIDCDTNDCADHKYFALINGEGVRGENATRGKRGFKSLLASDGTPCDFTSGETCKFEVWLADSPSSHMWFTGHEIGHMLGFDHEQSREDRLDFLKARDPLPEDCQVLGDVKPNEDFIGHYDYDLGSIMHYFDRPSRCWTVKEAFRADIVDRYDPNLPNQNDLKKVRLLYGVNGDWLRNKDWCSAYGDATHVGDFNGDEREDLLCHNIRASSDTAGKRAVDLASSSGRFVGSNWESGTSRFCYGTNRKLLIGDFNGDGRDDLGCHNVGAGSLSLDYANTAGELTGQNWPDGATHDWGCIGPSASSHVGDFNNDGRADLLCHDKDTGRRRIYLADENGRFGGLSWTSENSGASSWCSGSTEAIQIGDFDGDGASDALCFDKSSGRRRIDFAFDHGNLKGTNWDSNTGGSPFCVGSTRDLFVADITGDGLSDLVCHDRRTGSLSRICAEGNVGWADGKGLDAVDATFALGFCNADDARLVVGKFNNDGRADLLCHNEVTGHQSILYARMNGGFVVP